MIKVLPDKAVLVEYGPMRMSIKAFENDKPLVDLSKEGGHVAMRVLEDAAQSLPVLKKPVHAVDWQEAFPAVVRRMIEATRRIGEPDLTPLAAVAGAVSDVVADFMFSQGGTKIIVDNGGDIAIRLREGEVVRVGMKTEINARNPTYLLAIDFSMGIGGITTSGFGGRSFTKGIASAVTVISENASISDAAATVIGNSTNVQDPNIVRTLAERIYPDTDIVGQWVTTGVGELSQEKTEEACQNGLSKAYSICHKGLIKGAMIAVKGNVVFTSGLESLVEPLGSHSMR
jgi:ApbE superfamily uncharacterized protein (UPF0280 family)